MLKRMSVVCVIAALAILGSAGMGNATAVPGSNVSRPPLSNPPRDTGDVVYQFPGPSINVDGMTWDGTNLWIASDGLDSIYKIDTLGNIISSFQAPNTTATGLCWDGQNLWCADGGTIRIYKLDPVTGAILDSIPGPGTAVSCEGLAWMNDTLWNTNWNNNTLWWLDPTNGTIWGQFPAPGTGSTGLAWDSHDNVLWNSDQLTDFIYKIDPATGTVITSFPCPDAEVQDLAFDGTYLWTCGWTSGIVYKMDIGYVAEPANILFVDDDENGPNVEMYYETSFNNLGYAYDKWVVFDSGGTAPDEAVMSNYEIVVWATGEDYVNTLTPTDTTEIGFYLLNVMNPGKLWLSSQDVLYDIDPVGWMHVGSHVDDISCTQVTGVGPIMSGFSSPTTGTAIIDYADQIEPDGTSWTEMQNESNLSNTIATGPPSTPYSVFFNGFAFELINDEADRDTMMYRIINWLQTGIEESPAIETARAFGFAPMVNPVRGQIFIAYNTSTPGRVALKVYDSAGRLVRTLVDAVVPAGMNTVAWDAKDEHNRAVTNGIYFVKLSADEQSATHKLVLIK
ncbi:MAG: T9SS type A sorting domain-containing protein [candidate division WOR-3 bacterium]|nr:MAG: T9SS type A sorting domain-containing protein [candidate division WOR-3 bacterium]